MDFGDRNISFDLDSADWQLIKQTFRTTFKKKPENMHEFNKLYINMIRSIAPIIKTKRKGKGKNQHQYYEYDNELLTFHYKLALKRQKN